MVSTRFTSFVCVLLFILYESSAEVHQVTEKIDHVADRKSFIANDGSPSAAGKKILDAVPTPREASNLKLEGRKMKRRFLMKQMMKSKDTVINLEDSKNSGATDSDTVNFTKVKRKLKTEIDMNVESVISHHARRDDLNSFVALNADYHPPKPHPPKNN